MRILFIPSTNPSVKVMGAFAAWLASRGHDALIITNALQRGYLKTVEKSHLFQPIDLKTLRQVEWSENGVRSEGDEEQTVKTGKKTNGLNTKIQRMHQRNSSSAILILAVYWLLQTMRFRLMWRVGVGKMKADVAFIWGDNAGTVNGELLNLLRRSSVKLVHLPVSLSDQDIIARLRVDFAVQRLQRRSPLVSRLLAKMCPAQLYELEGQLIFYYHPSEIIAMSLLQCLPKKPWILGENRADHVCLSTVFERDYWLERGLSPGKVSVTGSLDLEDAAHAVSLIRLRHPELFEHHRPLVLVNMPNLIEHGTLHSWAEFWDHVNLMLDPLVEQDIDLVVSLHPKAERANYQAILANFRCQVVQGDIAAWIDLADLYVSAASTTELIADSLGVPVLDFGLIYGFRSKILERLSSICFCDTYDQYREKTISGKLTGTSGIPRRYKAGPQASHRSSPYKLLEQIAESTCSSS